MMQTEITSQRKSFHPFWLLLSVTLPQLMLLGLMAYIFQLIHTLLKPDELSFWYFFGTLMALQLVGYTCYSIFCWISRQAVDWRLSFVVLLTYICSLYWGGHNIQLLLPRTIPSWMIQADSFFLYPLALTMPSLLYAIALALAQLTPEPEKQKLWNQGLAAIAIPVCWYIFANLRGVFFFPSSEVMMHVTLVMGIASLVVFLFLVARIVLVVMSKKDHFFRVTWWIWKALFVFVAPIIALFVYSSMTGGGREQPIFGSFEHPLYYVLAVFNGAILLWPREENVRVTGLLFLLRCGTYPFTLFFCFTFLPLLPLSIFFIVAFGLGFLILTPFVVMLCHSRDLYLDVEALLPTFGKRTLLVGALVAFSIIPIGLTVRFAYHRSVFHQAMRAAFSSELSAKNTPRIDKSALQDIIQNVRMSHARRRGGTGDVFFLSMYYRWWVLDNLTLSEKKLRRLEGLFLGKKVREPGWYLINSGKLATSTASKLVKLHKLSSKTTFDAKSRTFRSEIFLELKNGPYSLMEYKTHISIPKGVWVSNYWLWIGKQKVQGLLKEKRAALWVYRQILRTSQDPGLMYYHDLDTLALHIYPFQAKEKRKTSFELLHKEPFVLQIDGKSVKLGDSNKIPPSTSPIVGPDKEAIFIPKAARQKMPRVKRVPYVHFLVDCSVKGAGQKAAFSTRMKKFLQKYPSLIKGARISLINYRIRTLRWTDDWHTALQRFPSEGGFFLEGALQAAILKHFHHPSTAYPIFVVVTSHPKRAILSKKTLDLQFAIPETDAFYVLNEGDNLYSFAFRAKENRLTRLPQGKPLALDPKEVLVWPNATASQLFLPPDAYGTFVLPGATSKNRTHKPKEPWQEGLRLRKMWLQKLMGKDTQKHWLGQIKDSWRSGILTHVTAFIVLENKAQWEALRRKQKEVLSGKRFLSTSRVSDLNPMPEPSFWLVLGLMALWVSWRRRRKDTQKSL